MPTDSQIEVFASAVSNIVGDKRLVFLVYEFDEDGFGYSRRPIKPIREIMSGREIVNLVVEEFTNQEYEVELPKTMKDVLGWVNDAVEDKYSRTLVMTVKEYKKWSEEQLREKCEPLVSSICREYKVEANSLAMISAIKNHYMSRVRSERNFRDSHESRMERWGNCMMGGAGQEGFFSDDDYATTLIEHDLSDLREIWRYLHRYCPLLMARWSENKASRKQK